MKKQTITTNFLLIILVISSWFLIEYLIKTFAFIKVISFNGFYTPFSDFFIDTVLLVSMIIISGFLILKCIKKLVSLNKE